MTLRGRVASLLEVGTGFHPELTGRENIFLNGAILGMSKAEIRKKFDEIVDFAGVEKFLDTPVKRYSSGMYVRLAFAVAAHLEPEILIIDEVLAVGDAEFQKKCLGKMQEVAKGGRTVLFSGRVQDALSFYLDQSNSQDVDFTTKFSGPLSSDFELHGIAINRTSVSGNAFTVTDSKELTIELDYSFAREIATTLGLAFFVDGTRLFTLIDADGSAAIPHGRQRSTFKLPDGLLKRGGYQIGVGIVQSNSATDWLWNESILTLQVLSDVADASVHAHGLLNVECESSRAITATSL